MEYYVKSVIPIIESNYDKFTTTEKTIADLFYSQSEKDGLFCKSYRRTFVYFKSNTDTICKKCGYHGYKEFIYQYEETF